MFLLLLFQCPQNNLGDVSKAFPVKKVQVCGLKKVRFSRKYYLLETSVKKYHCWYQKPILVEPCFLPTVIFVGVICIIRKVKPLSQH